jgi:hypothetical protein
MTKAAGISEYAMLNRYGEVVKRSVIMSLPNERLAVSFVSRHSIEYKLKRLELK